LPAFSRIGQAISIFEQTNEISPFDSKFDRFLQGEYVMSSEEAAGWQLVQSHCMGCHDSSDITGTAKQTFSNYRYYNLGVPVNQQVRQALEMTEKDPGLYGNPSVDDVNQSGKFKTPTLRNSAVTGPYMHNGVFKSLETVIAFKDFRRVANNNERVLNPENGLNWGETDYPERVQYSANEALSDEDIGAIVAFLKLLTDQRYESLIR